MKFLCWDLEVRQNPGIVGWKNYEPMGISYGCFYTSWDDKHVVFGEDGLQSLLDGMAQAEVITGFNILDFDFPLLFATMNKLGMGAPKDRGASLIEKTYDPLFDIRAYLMTKFAKGWHLQAIARANLTIEKSGDGADAPGLWQDGKHDELKSYVTQDVRVETALFLHCREHRRLVSPNAPGRVKEVSLRGMDALCKQHAWPPKMETVVPEGAVLP